MALVAEMRNATTIEPGDIFVKVMIWREGQELSSHLHVVHILGERYKVISGGPEAVRIFGESQEVYIKPISNQRFSHLITQ